MPSPAVATPANTAKFSDSKDAPDSMDQGGEIVTAVACIGHEQYKKRVSFNLQVTQYGGTTTETRELCDNKDTRESTGRRSPRDLVLEIAKQYVQSFSLATNRTSPKRLITSSIGPKIAAQEVPSIVSLLPGLASVLANKQGVLYLSSGKGPNQAQLLKSHINDFEVFVAHNTILNSVTAPRDLDDKGSKRWRLGIKDLTRKTERMAPLTIIQLDSETIQSSRMPNAEHMQRIRQHYTTHLADIHPKHQARSTQAAILCPENPQLAQQITVSLLGLTGSPKKALKASFSQFSNP